MGSVFRQDVGGVAAIEFAIIGPVLVLILAGASDIGLAVMTRMQVNEGVSAAANAALVSGAGLSSASADATATVMAKILQRTRRLANPTATYKITFNGGRSYDFRGGSGVASGAASAADECRCPMQANGAIAWGAKVDCNTPCSNMSLSGRYVSIEVTWPYTPLFAQYGFIRNEGIHVQTLALVQ
ncbi:TadE/TadG family type IV pilus assembly protein [Aureimonas sp. AU12]|uniref:TadE/TadG family type IV pilus assembly protein n=1 Tax=Aureimonas sp. AU12 TaxID=1638161 RepID=UPI000AA0B0AB|nr:TadE/TadG family type IV pilus assembly protein [Aureimonas sp. AU12]